MNQIVENVVSRDVEESFKNPESGSGCGSLP